MLPRSHFYEVLRDQDFSFRAIMIYLRVIIYNADSPTSMRINKSFARFEHSTAKKMPRKKHNALHPSLKPIVTHPEICGGRLLSCIKKISTQHLHQFVIPVVPFLARECGVFHRKIIPQIKEFRVLDNLDLQNATLSIIQTPTGAIAETF